MVGGHCISVDPYYLTYKSEKLGYKPDVILSGRNVNDKMGKFVAQKIVRLMTDKDIELVEADILILGVSFKENCPDIRNTKIKDVYEELVLLGANVEVFDPVANKQEVKKELSIDLITDYNKKKYTAIVLAVAHDDFKSIDFSALKDEKTVIFDAKSFLPANWIDGRL